MSIKIISLRKIIFSLFIAMIIYIPFSLVSAQTGSGAEGDGTPTGTGNPAVQSVTLNNPLKIGSIEDLLSSILNVVIILALPIIVFFIIYSGFLYVTARGNPAKIQEATKSLTYAIIGGVLVIGAVAIAEIVKNLVASFSA